MSLAIRERPPLRLSIDAQTPSGSRYRWGQDEPKAANVPSDLSFTSSMPGGFESLNCTLPRKPEREYSDLERFTNLRVLGPGGAVAWEGRLESSPRVSGDQMTVSPGAVGWQAHLEDDTSARMIYMDRDLSAWGSMVSSRRLTLLDAATKQHIFDPEVYSDADTPTLAITFESVTNGKQPRGEAIYDAGPSGTVASIDYQVEQNANVGSGFEGYLSVNSELDISGSGEATSDQITVSGTNVYSDATFSPTTPQRVAMIQFFQPSTTWADTDGPYVMFVRHLAVIGNHGLTMRSSIPDRGIYASDVVAHAVRTWAPLLTLSTGSSGSVTDSSFVIPQLAFKDPTTAADIIQGANRYHLRDWAVWEDRTFYYHERGARGRSWRARVGPAQLSETGPSIENLWNGVIVKFSDVDGTTKTVGPTGSGCDTESTDCEDSDPLNPANELGIHRWTQIDMGGVSTAAGATEVGRRFLIEAAQYNASGQAQLVGHVEDDRGVLHPAWRVRAGDTITFVDAASTTPRRIVKASYSHASRTCSVDLDAPPDGLDSLLARLQVVIAPLGL